MFEALCRFIDAWRDQYRPKYVLVVDSPDHQILVQRFESPRQRAQAIRAMATARTGFPPEKLAEKRATALKNSEIDLVEKYRMMQNLIKKTAETIYDTQAEWVVNVQKYSFTVYTELD